MYLGCMLALVSAAAAPMSAAGLEGGGLTLDELCGEHESRVAGLFEALDLSRPGLEESAALHARGDLPGACRALLDYYGARFPALPPPPEGTPKDDARAERIMAFQLEFYRVEDEAPRRGGNLDWTHRGPTNDREWAWALNRHGHIDQLLGGYLATRNPRYAAGIGGYLSNWVLQSPYPGQKSAAAQWRGLEAALRMHPWHNVFTTLQHEPAFPPAARILMLSALPDHAHYLRNFHAPTGNWTTMEMNGLARIAVTWPEFREATAWLEYTKATMLPSMTEQVYPDGVQMELTSHYHRVAAHNFQRYVDILDEGGAKTPEAFRAQLEKMWDYLAFSMRPNGHGVLNNDSDYDHTAPVVRELHQRYDRPDWLYMATQGRKGTAPEGTPWRFFSWAGQALFRDRWEQPNHWAFFDVGPLGTGHQHMDKLHFSLFVHGRDVLVDSGRWSYVPDQWRLHFQGTSSHNTILLDGHGQGRYAYQAEAPLEDAWVATPEYRAARGSFDGPYGRLEGEARHTRTVLHRPPHYFLILDHIETDRPRRLTVPWHFHPDCAVRMDGMDAHTADAGTGHVRLVPFGKRDWDVSIVKGQETPEIQGWYSADYNLKEPAPAVLYSGQSEGDVVFGWLIAISETAPPPAGKAEIETCDSQHTIRIELPGIRESLSLPTTGAPRATLQMQ